MTRSFMVRRPILTMLVTATLTIMATPASAQTQPLVLNIHDVAPDGYTYVGNPTTFGYVLLNDDGTSNVHKNGQLRISQNGILLYETTGLSNAHDYDALNPVFFAFPRAGPYEIQSSVVSGATINQTFRGEVAPLKDPIKATITADVFPDEASVNEPSRFVFSLRAENGSLLEHTDALFEVRRASDNWLAFRTHLHSHKEPVEIEYAFPESGEYLVRVVGYQAFPSKTGVAFEPVTFSKTIEAAASTPVPLRTAQQAQHESASMPNYNLDAEPYVLVLTTDPPGTASAPATVGMFGNVRLNALLYDTTTKELVQHVNFEATLSNSLGTQRFSSKSLHEYDGHLEVVDQEPTPGMFTYTVTAMKGEWKETKSIQFNVVAAGPNAPPGVGPTIVTATGLDGIKAGIPQQIQFMAATAAGTAHGHSEIELQVLRGDRDGPPILINKLHTHGDGKFSATITFPDPGEYTLIMDVETVHADASPRYYFEEIGKAPIVTLNVAEGIELPDYMLGEAEEGLEVPEMPVPFFVAALAVAAAVFVRRRHA